MKALTDILVVSLEQAVAAPYTSCKLADAGARVIKLERPEGDFARGYDHYVHGSSAYFVWLNRGKQSCRVNLKAEDDLALVKRMLERADVFIQNLVPGATGRLGIGSTELRQIHPRLITCDISGYGSTGPYRDKKAYDLLVQAESGLVSLTGTPEAPGRVGVSVCDIATGMYAYQAILEALIARQRTGKGAAIEVSLFNSLGDWMNVPYLQHHYGGATPKRVGLAHPSISPYGQFLCANGDGILISIQNEREWQVLCRDVLKRPDLADEPRFSSNAARIEHREEVDSAIQEVIATLPRPELAARLDAERIAYGIVSDMDDLVAHPQNRFVAVETPGGTADLLGPPALIDGEPESFGPVPELGAHDALVRTEFAET